jgi:hypothetical protein
MEEFIEREAREKSALEHPHISHLGVSGGEESKPL